MFQLWKKWKFNLKSSARVGEDVELTELEASLEEESDLNVYPIPTSDYLYIKNYNEGDTYTVFDLSGVVVDNGIVSDQYDVTNLASGYYMIKIGEAEPIAIVKK